MLAPSSCAGTLSQTRKIAPMKTEMTIQDSPLVFHGSDEYHPERTEEISSWYTDTDPEARADELNALLSELGLDGDRPMPTTSTIGSSECGTSKPPSTTADLRLSPITNLPEYSGADAADSPPTIIQVQPGKLRDALAASEGVLARTGQYFQRSGRIVCVSVDPVTKANHTHEMNDQSLMVALAGLSEWCRLDKRTGGWIAIDPCPRVCKLLAESWTYSQLPILNGTAHQPHLRPDGTICTTPGYDPATGLMGVFDAGEVCVPANPNREDAAKALELLDDLLSECAFASPEDRSAALSALLTAAVRPSLPLAPMFHVMAHQSGSGKSYLCQLISAVATANPGTPVPFPRSNDACDKLLLAQLMSDPAVIEFDNLTSDLRPFDKLCSALTSEHLEGRVLGRSRTVTVKTKVLIMSSGNNVRPVADMVRRCILIQLDPGVETPAARVFKRPHLLDEVRCTRTKYVAAALTVVRAWLTSGEPPAECRPLGSFGEWSKWCRESLIWLGFEDPAAGLFEGLECDPEKLLLGRVLDGWHACCGSSVTMIRHLVPMAMRPDADEDFRDALIEASGGIDTVNMRKLGHWLSRQDGRVVRGLRLVRARKTGSAQNWCVEPLA